MRHLKGFAGVLQVDGYAGYKVLAERNAVSLAFCWSHVRRRFYELAQAGPAPIATETLARIAELYRIESDIRGHSAEERRAVRQATGRPVADALEPWLREKLGLVSQKSKLAEAIRYALSRWAGLTRYLDDGRIEIDNNVVERAIRPIALNRKNALFAGSDGGAEHWATIASLVETCKLNNVEPRTRLDAGSYGTMGVGFGFAVAAAVVQQDRPVVSVSGDSAFGFSGMELETICRYNLPITTIVLNNGGIGGGFDEWPADRALPPSALSRTARYEKVCEAFGGQGYYVEDPADLRPTLDKAISSGKPSVVHVLIAAQADRKPQEFHWKT